MRSHDYGCLGWQRAGTWRVNKGASRSLVIFCFSIWVPVISVHENSVYEKSSLLGYINTHILTYEYKYTHTHIHYTLIIEMLQNIGWHAASLEKLDNQAGRLHSWKKVQNLTMEQV